MMKKIILIITILIFITLLSSQVNATNADNLTTNEMQKENTIQLMIT